MSIGPRVRTRRLAAKLSLSGLAGRAGIPIASLSRFETGKREPSVTILVALANALGCTPNDLLLPPGTKRKGKP